MMEVIYSLAVTFWTIIRITVSNPLLLTVAVCSLLMNLVKQHAKS